MKRSGIRALPLLLLSLIVGLVGLTGLARPASAAFQYKVYTGAFSVLPNFTPLTPTTTGSSAVITSSVAAPRSSGFPRE